MKPAIQVQNLSKRFSIATRSDGGRSLIYSEAYLAYGTTVD